MQGGNDALAAWEKKMLKAEVWNFSSLGVDARYCQDLSTVLVNSAMWVSAPRRLVERRETSVLGRSAVVDVVISV